MLCVCFFSGSNLHLLEGALGEQVALDTAEGFVGVVVGLLDQAQLLPLNSVKPRVDAVVLLQSLQSQDKQLPHTGTGRRRRGGRGGGDVRQVKTALATRH